MAEPIRAARRGGPSGLGQRKRRQRVRQGHIVVGVRFHHLARLNLDVLAMLGRGFRYIFADE